MKKQVSTNSICFLFVFLFILSMGFLLNLRNLVQNRGTVYEIYLEEGYSKAYFEKIDNLYRENVNKKDKWIEMYGAVQRLLGRSIIGNMEYVKNENGLINFMLNIDAQDIVNADVISNDLLTLNSVCREKGIPFFYVPLPLRNDGSVPSGLVNANLYFEKIRKNIENEEVSIVNVANLLKIEKMPLEKFYMKTDVHLTTEAEILIANILAKVLQDKGVNIGEELITGTDDSRYNMHSHKLLGNLARSVGKYYNGVDIFNEYIPVDDRNTMFIMKDLVSDNFLKDGIYSHVVMNNYDDLGDENLYWVTNYLRFGQYAYNIENKQSDGPNLLIIADSCGYRAIAFLTLCCRNITFIDPRFPVKGINAIENAMDQYNYDAVICLHGYPLGDSLYGK